MKFSLFFKHKTVQQRVAISERERAAVRGYLMIEETGHKAVRTGPSVCKCLNSKVENIALLCSNLFELFNCSDWRNPG